MAETAASYAPGGLECWGSIVGTPRPEDTAGGDDKMATDSSPIKELGEVSYATVPLMLANEVGNLLYHGKTKEERMLEFVKENAAASNSTEVVESIDKFCDDNWMMNFGDVKGKIVDDLIKKHGVHKIKTAVEFGGYVGYATVRLAAVLPPSAAIHSIEATERYCDTMKGIYDHAGFGQRIKIHNVYSTDFIKTMVAEGIKADYMLFDHQLSIYTEDIVLLIKHKLLNPGCLIVHDNVLFPGCPDHKKWMLEQEGVLFESHIIKTHVDIPGHGRSGQQTPDELLVSKYIGYDKAICFISEELLGKVNSPNY